MWPLHLSVALLARLMKRISAVVPGFWTHGCWKNSFNWVATDRGGDGDGDGLVW